MLIDTLTAALLSVPTVDVPPVTPTFDGPGAAAALKLVGQIAGWFFIASLAGLLVAAGLIAVGHFSKMGQLQKAGLWGVVGCIAAAAIAGGATGLIQFGANIQLF